jgi:hypothetical protein
MAATSPGPVLAICPADEFPEPFELPDEPELLEELEFELGAGLAGGLLTEADGPLRVVGGVVLL